MDEYHIPVLLEETISSLNIKPGKKYIDATLGGGGHTETILRHGGEVLAIDCDQEATDYARKRLAAFLKNFVCPGPQSPLRTPVPEKLGAFSQITGTLTIVKDNFAHLKEIAQKFDFPKVAGILYDLGVSSHQLETPYRGFSFGKDALLDMRMDQNLQVKAQDLVNGLNEGELYELFKKFGEEHYSRAIAHYIIRARKIKPIQTTEELSKIVSSARPRRGKFDRTHPATRVFQALRIAVNDELNNLKVSLPQACDLLEKEGRLVVISFHSLEDRIVKNFFKEESQKGQIKIITKHPIKPTEDEIEKNPRARSAKMRVGEKR